MEAGRFIIMVRPGDDGAYQLVSLGAAALGIEDDRVVALGERVPVVAARLRHAFRAAAAESGRNSGPESR
jgi:hypothetical protein